MGVHRPAIRKKPARAAIKSRAKAIDSEGFPPERPTVTKEMRVILRLIRSSRRPNPGQLFGKVENRRCRIQPNSIVLSLRWG